MPDLVLNDLEQRALRDLLAGEPCPGSPLPSAHVLERLAALVPADGLCAVFQDGSYCLTEGVFLGDDPEPELPEAHTGPFYLGVMHWSHHPLAAESCGALEGITDGVAIGFRNGSDGLVQIALGRKRAYFTQRDLAMLRVLTPLFARLVRERPTPGLPAALTVQERRVLSHVAAGESNTEIAVALFIAPSTVRKHLENAYRKLGVSGRVAAVARLQGRDLPDLDLRERLARLG
jgi:DNA-binding CsgD family transcriptional regulator